MHLVFDIFNVNILAENHFWRLLNSLFIIAYKFFKLLNRSFRRLFAPGRVEPFWSNLILDFFDPRLFSTLIYRSRTFLIDSYCWLLWSTYIVDSYCRHFFTRFLLSTPTFPCSFEIYLCRYIFFIYRVGTKTIYKLLILISESGSPLYSIPLILTCFMFNFSWRFVCDIINRYICSISHPCLDIFCIV